MLQFSLAGFSLLLALALASAWLWASNSVMSVKWWGFLNGKWGLMNCTVWSWPLCDFSRPTLDPLLFLNCVVIPQWWQTEAESDWISDICGGRYEQSIRSVDKIGMTMKEKGDRQSQRIKEPSLETVNKFVPVSFELGFFLCHEVLFLSAKVFYWVKGAAGLGGWL